MMKPRHRRDPQRYYDEQYAELARCAAGGGAVGGDAGSSRLHNSDDAHAGPSTPPCSGGPEKSVVTEEDGSPTADALPSVPHQSGTTGKIRITPATAVAQFQAKMRVDPTAGSTANAGAALPPGYDAAVFDTAAREKYDALMAKQRAGAHGGGAGGASMAGLRTLFESEGGTDGSMALVCGAVNDAEYTERGRAYRRCYSFMAREARAAASNSPSPSRLGGDTSTDSPSPGGTPPPGGGGRDGAAIPPHRRPLVLDDSLAAINARVNREMFQRIAPEVVRSICMQRDGTLL